MNKFELKRRQSIEKILNTAIDLISRNGYENTSMRKIAKAAGIALGLTYNYFKCKDDLLKVIFDMGLRDIKDSFQPPVSNLSPEQRFKIHIHQTFDILKQKKVFWRLMHSIRMQKPVMGKLMGEVSVIKDHIMENLIANLKGIGTENAGMEAYLLFAMIDGAANHYLINDSYPIEEIEALIIKKYVID